MDLSENVSGLLARKTFHLVGGMVTPLGALLLPRGPVLWALGIATSLAVVVDIVRFASPECNHRFVALSGPLIRKQEASQVNGSTYLLISTFLTFFLFPREIAVAAVSFLAVGDSFGAVVGVAFSRGDGPEKNWQGRLACFFSALAAGIILGYVVLNMNLLVILIGAATAAVVETLTLPVNDNITIPVSSALAMVLLAYFV